LTGIEKIKDIPSGGPDLGGMERERETKIYTKGITKLHIQAHTTVTAKKMPRKEGNIDRENCASKIR